MTALRTPSRWAAAAVVALAAAAALLITARAQRSPGPAVVTVLVAQPAGPAERATGFVTDGGVVTVAHVLDEGRDVRVGGRAARVVRVDRAADLALLDAGEVEGDATSPDAGERLVLVRDGHARAVPVQVRRHVTAHIRDSAGPRTYSRPSLELGARVAGGDSGAPVVGETGELLGVVFAASRNADDRAWAVDAGAVDALLER
jgi:S1-C subfamily serine protease